MKKSFVFLNVLFVIMVGFAQEVPSSVTFSYCFPTESDTYLTVGCDLPYMWNAQSCVETGTYSFLTTNSRGCDSTARLHLTVTNWENEVIKPAVTMCPADLPYIWTSEKADQNNVYDLVCNAVGNYQRTYTNVHGCDSVVSFTINEATGCRPIGSARGLFSVSANQQVYFAMGNLQYKASQNGTAGDITHTVAGNTTKPGVFRFAEHQYDWVGNNTASTGNVYENNVKCSNALASSTYTGWIDQFCFGTSGYNNKYPYSTATGTSAYIQNNLTGTYANYDWGVYNAISNGGNEPGLWRTLSRTEWMYLMETRTNATKKYGLASVNGVHGLIILPDTWLHPDGISSFVPYKYETAAYDNNVYYTEDHASYVAGITNSWDLMENAGAVFFPCGGYRQGSSFVVSTTNGYYYSSTWGGSSRYAYYMCFYYQSSHYYIRSSDGGVNQQDYGSTGCSVRLVQNYVP